MRRILALFLVLGCDGSLEGAGGASDGGPEAPDAGAPPADAAPPEGLAVSGTVKDFFDSTPLADVEVATLGLTPPRSDVSAAGGLYTVQGIPDNATFSLLATAPANYRVTVGPSVTMATEPVTHDVLVVSSVGAQRQHATVDLPVEPGTAILIIDVLEADGTPAEGAPLGTFALSDPAGNPVGAGPYVQGALGDVDPGLISTTAFNGFSRLIYLNVPAGEVLVGGVVPFAIIPDGAVLGVVQLAP